MYKKYKKVVCFWGGGGGDGVVETGNRSSFVNFLNDELSLLFWPENPNRNSLSIKLLLLAVWFLVELFFPTIVLKLGIYSPQNINMKSNFAAKDEYLPFGIQFSFALKNI